MFRAFLDQRVERRKGVPGRVRAQAASLLLHAAGLTLLLLAARQLEPEPPDAAAAPPGLMVSLLQPVAYATPPAASGPAASRVADPAPAAARRRTPARAPRAVTETDVPVATAVPGPALARGGQVAAMDDGGLAMGPVAVVSGDAIGDGAGGAGTGGRGRRRPELFGRVIGSGLRRGAPVRADLPFISLKEATALRTQDHFPRLPAALWTERGPYLVALQVCVSSEGRVSEAALMSNRSAQLDSLVLQAVHGWRYHPRLQDGEPSPFCHGILIKYEIAY